MAQQSKIGISDKSITMTAKEIAQELVGRYRKEILKGKYRIDGFVIEELAEECALIAVDEIFSIINRDMNYQNVYAYFLEVKQEIEKL